MSIISKIQSYFQDIKAQKAKELNIVSYDHERLRGYHDSLGWYLEKLGEQSKFPEGIIHLSTAGLKGNKILVYYDSREINLQEIVTFLESLGVKVGQ